MISPEGMTFLTMLGASIFGGGVAWNRVNARLDAIDHPENGMIKTNRLALDTKIDQAKEDLETSAKRHNADDAREFHDNKESFARLWGWKDTHEKETADVRLALYTDINKILNKVDVQESQFKGIVKMFEALEIKIDDIAKQLRRPQ